MHGRGAGDLLDRLVAAAAGAGPKGPTRRRRPSRGSRWWGGRTSASRRLFNRLVGEERSVVFEEAGHHARQRRRACVDVAVTGPCGSSTRPACAAQIRVQGVEYYSFVRATRAIERADVAVVVIERREGFTVEDKKIAVPRRSRRAEGC